MRVVKLSKRYFFDFKLGYGKKECVLRVSVAFEPGPSYPVGAKSREDALHFPREFLLGYDFACLRSGAGSFSYIDKSLPRGAVAHRREHVIRMTNYCASPSVRLEGDEDAPKNPEKSIPVDKHLFDARTVLITGPVTQEMAQDVCSRLLALSQVSSDPITVIVSSPGGHVESGDMIHDMIRFIQPEVRILGMGWVASAGALIYVSVPKERRFCTSNTRFLLHQPSGGAGGMATDIEIQAKEILKMRDRLNQIFADATGQKLERIEKDTDRDYWMSPEEGIEYGLVGKVVKNVSELA